MRLAHYPIEQLRKEILAVVGRYLEIGKYRVFFFGSRVEGKGNERSDIDVGIEGPDEVPGEIMAHIKEDVDKLPVLYKIEVVDFSRVSPDFRDVALRHIERII